MKIFFFKNTFKLTDVEFSECESLEKWFAYNQLNSDDFISVQSPNSDSVCVFFKLRGGSSKNKNVISVVLGLSLLFSGGAAAGALFGAGGAAIARTLGVGLLLSGGGGLILGQTKLPQLSFDEEVSANASYQWNVGQLNTTRGVKGVTFGSNVVPEGEVIAYRSFGSSDFNANYIEKEAYYTDNYGRVISVGQYNKLEQLNNRYPRNRYDMSIYSYHAASRQVSSFNVTKANSYLEMLIGAGEGPLDSITNLKINNIPVAELGLVENQDYCIRLGENNQSSIPMTNLDNQAGYLAINQVVPQKTASSDDYALYVTPAECAKVEISVKANAWYLYNLQSGAKNEAYISFLVQFRKVGTSSWQGSGVSQPIRSGVPLKASDPFYFSTTIQFPDKDTYEIRAQNVSALANHNAGLLTASEYASLPDRAVIELSIDNIACYNNIAQVFPNTALIYLRLPATQIMNGSMPQITWKQTRASVYAFDGSSYVTKPANNLAWAIYDIFAQIRKDNFTNSYKNLGEDVANIDYAAFVEFASFCVSIQATGNWFLNRKRPAWEIAQDVAASARAFIGIRNGKIHPYYDKPETISQIFTSGNTDKIVHGLISKSERTTRILAKFNDENNDFKETQLSIPKDDSSDTSDAVSLTFPGLSSAASVYNHGDYLIRRNKYVLRTVTIDVGIDALVSELYDVCGVQSDIMEWGAGGTVYSVNGYEVNLGTVVTLEANKTYSLLVRHPTGVLERRVPDETVGSFSTLTFSNDPFATDVVAGDVFSFGVTTFEVKPFRIESITRASDHTARIEASEYSGNVHVEGSAPIINYSVINAGINSVSKSIKDNAITYVWSAPNALYVDIYINGVFYQRALSDSASLPAINGEYTIKLVPVAADGTQGESFEETITSTLSKPSTLRIPTIEKGSGSYILTFNDVPLDANIILIVIRENGIERARKTVHGSKVVIALSLGGGQHFLEAVAINIFGVESDPVNFETPVQVISGWNIGVDSISKDGLEINSNGRISGNYTSGSAGWLLDKNGDAEVNNLTARGKITSVVYAQKEASVVGGELLVRPGEVITKIGAGATDRFRFLFNLVRDDILGNDFQFGYATMTDPDFADYSEFVAEEERCFGETLEVLYDVDNTDSEDLPEFSGTQEEAISGNRIFVKSKSQFSTGDIIRVKSGVSLEFWGVVTESGEDEIFGDYIDVFVESGELFDGGKGQVVINYGQSGAGGILLDGEAPKIDFWVNNGVPWLGLVPFMRLGNIKGIGGFTDDTPGVYIGKAAGHHLTYDEVSGILAFTGMLQAASGTFSGQLDAASGSFKSLSGGNRCFAPENGSIGIGTSQTSETTPVYVKLCNLWTQLSQYPPFTGVYLVKVYDSIIRLILLGNYGRPGNISATAILIGGDQLRITLQIHHFKNGEVWLYVPPVNNAWSTVEVLESLDDSVACQKNAPDLTLHNSFNIILGMGASNSAIAGGVILNWGRVASSSGTSVSFQIPFSDTNYIVVIDDEVDRETWTYKTQKLTTGFSYSAQHVITIDWIAIGR